MENKKRNKAEKLNDFKIKQFEDLCSDYNKMSKSIDNMTGIVEDALEKLESNIKADEDNKVAAKVNSLSALIYAALKLQEHKMELHANYDDLIESIVPEDVITTIALDRQRSNEKNNLEIIDPLANIKQQKRA